MSRFSFKPGKSLFDIAESRERLQRVVRALIESKIEIFVFADQQFPAYVLNQFQGNQWVRVEDRKGLEVYAYNGLGPEGYIGFRRGTVEDGTEFETATHFKYLLDSRKTYVSDKDASALIRILDSQLCGSGPGGSGSTALLDLQKRRSPRPIQRANTSDRNNAIMKFAEDLINADEDYFLKGSGRPDKTKLRSRLMSMQKKRDPALLKANLGRLTETVVRKALVGLKTPVEE